MDSHGGYLTVKSGWSVCCQVTYNYNVMYLSSLSHVTPVVEFTHNSHNQPSMNSDNNPHTYPPSHIPVEAQQMVVFDSMLQSHIAEMQELFQQQFNAEKFKWMKQQEETYEQELALGSEIEKLRLQLAQTQVQPPSG